LRWHGLPARDLSVLSAVTFYTPLARPKILSLSLKPDFGFWPSPE
jgi:hypothetical protein